MHSRSKQMSVAIDAANSACEFIRSHFGKVVSAKNKVVLDESMGLVTAADLEAENVIVKQIHSSFPDDSILAEESHTSADTNGNLWVIDPLDGTNNFAHGIPHFSVSIAYCENGTIQCGVVANPSNGEICWAQQGRGAWLGDQQVHVNDHRSLDQTILATGFYYDRGEMMKATLATMNDLFEQNVQGIRRFGSAALDLAYVGLGRFGGYFEYRLSPWDFAAGKLFVEEAGGMVTDCLGNQPPLETTSLLATNGHLHSQLLSTIRPR